MYKYSYVLNYVIIPIVLAIPHIIIGLIENAGLDKSVFFLWSNVFIIVELSFLVDFYFDILPTIKANRKLKKKKTEIEIL